MREGGKVAVGKGSWWGGGEEVGRAGMGKGLGVWLRWRQTLRRSINNPTKYISDTRRRPRLKRLRLHGTWGARLPRHRISLVTSDFCCFTEEIYGEPLERIEVITSWLGAARTTLL